MPRVILDWDSGRKQAIIVSEFLENIRAQFSVPNKSKSIMTKKGKPTWYMADFISPITKSGRFDVGLYFEITRFLKDCKDIDYDISTTEPLQKQLIQTYAWNDTYTITQLSLPLRPYQESGVKRAIHMGYGVLVVGTAGGKTLLMASLVQTIRNHQQGLTSLIIMPSNLVKQTHKEFIEYGIPDGDMSIWGGDEEFCKAPIILASAEILKCNLITFAERTPTPEYKWKPEANETYKDFVDAHAKKEKGRKVIWTTKRKKILGELSGVDLILIDEVHSLRRGNVINEAIDLFPTRHRFGFTGTLPSGELDQWNILGTIGPIIIDIDSAILREKGYIAQVKAQVLKLHYKNRPRFKYDEENQIKAYDDECEFLYHSEFRNKVISYLTSKFNKNCLILVDSLDHGNTIFDLLKTQTQKKVYFIQGSVGMDDREKLRELMEVDDNIVCVAMSRIFAVGINIKNLHYVIFAQGGKAKVTLIQSIGRGLRLHEQKECLIMIDIADATHYGEKHLVERLAYYKDEQIEYETKELLE